MLKLKLCSTSLKDDDKKMYLLAVFACSSERLVEVDCRRSGSYSMQECPLRDSVGIDRIAIMSQVAAELSKSTLLPSRGILELRRIDVLS